MDSDFALSNFALINFAGPGSQVFQVTIWSHHNFTKNSLKELFLASGHIIKKEDTFVQDDKPQPNIDWYWVIPEKKKKMGR
jgi:hypothetical protein